MARYTVAHAAGILGVSRQTVYKYLNKNRDRYIDADSPGQTLITDEGLGFLRSEIVSADVRATVSEGDAYRQPVTADNTVKGQLRKAQERIRALEDDVTRLTNRIEVLTVQHDADRELIAQLRDTADKAHKALDQEQQLRMRDRVRPSWIKRLLGQTEKQTAPIIVDGSKPE